MHESLQVQCIWPGRSAMTSMHWTCSDSCTHVGPPLGYHKSVVHSLDLRPRYNYFSQKLILEFTWRSIGVK